MRRHIGRAIWLALAAAMIVVPSWFSTASAIPGIPDCKQAPTPDVPGQGIAGFFSNSPDKIPATADPFTPDAKTTIYQQYGYAGLRWSTYDLGCGPDAMRNPDAVIGTAFANWVVQPALALTALTGSVTEVAFDPTFLNVFDPVITQVSTALHDNLFATWIPAVLGLLGILLIWRANRASLATSAAAVGWALIVVILATALFRWPVAAGHAADLTVTRTLGTVVQKLDGRDEQVDPGTAVASNVVDTILYKGWLAGTLGSADSKTARKYGPDLFKAQALTWSEARLLENDPEAGKKLIEAKQNQWKDLADKIKDEDPNAYEYLTGQRSDTRVGYAFLSLIATFLALPFLLVSALLLLGCFMIVRLAVMMFPAFATLGAFPHGRGLVTGLGRTVAAAVVNSIIFGIGAGITVSVLGLLMAPSGAPAWLGLVLMPLFTFVMWMALKPFRRLTSMVSADDDHFRRATNSFNDAGSGLGSRAKDALVTAAAASVGAGAAVFASKAVEDSEAGPDTDRAEARPTPSWHVDEGIRALPAASGGDTGHPGDPDPGAQRAEGRQRPFEQPAPSTSYADSYRPDSAGAEAPLMPTEVEWDGDDEVYAIYRPDDVDSEADDVA
jgi:hypothetical protein